MSIDDVFNLRPGDKLVDTLVQEYFAFYKYDANDNHVLCTDERHNIVWLDPSRVERVF